MTSILFSFLGGYWWLFLIGVCLIAGGIAAGIAAYVFLPELVAVPWAGSLLRLAIMVGVFLLFAGYMMEHAYNRGYAAATAAVQAATAAEVKEAQAIADYWQKYAQGLLAQIASVGADNSKLQAELDKILADQAAVACLPQSVIDELRNVKGMRHDR